MTLGRRPREVYRAYSEEELLDGPEMVDDAPRESASCAPTTARGGASGRMRREAGEARVARSGRSLALTLVATLLGLAVGLGVVALVDRGGGAHPRATPGAFATTTPPAAAAAPRRRGGPRATVRDARARSVDAPGPRNARSSRSRPVAARIVIGEPGVEPGGAAQSIPSAPSRDVAASGPAPAAASGESGPEFGFER